MNRYTTKEIAAFARNISLSRWGRITSGSTHAMNRYATKEIAAFERKISYT
jgi:hypothetical protein